MTSNGINMAAFRATVMKKKEPTVVKENIKCSWSVSVVWKDHYWQLWQVATISDKSSHPIFLVDNNTISLWCKCSMSSQTILFNPTQSLHSFWLFRCIQTSIFVQNDARTTHCRCWEPHKKQRHWSMNAARSHRVIKKQQSSGKPEQSSNQAPADQNHVAADVHLRRNRQNLGNSTTTTTPVQLGGSPAPMTVTMATATAQIGGCRSLMVADVTWTLTPLAAIPVMIAQ